VLVTSASGKLAQATAAGIEGVSLFKDNGDGSSTYAVDLAAGVPAAARHARDRRVR
jgi:2',3'-cyclic-nucleotide 2'-phosphodiesterase/3'-nucleotidase